MSVSGLMLLLAAAVLAAALWIFARATELFAGRFEAGTFNLLRGRCPPGLLAELDDVARLEQLDRVTLTVRSDGGRPRVVASGRLSDGQLQQLRNVVGRFEVAQIRSGGKRA